MIITPQGEIGVREQAARIGLGRERDLTVAELGLPEDTVQFLEGARWDGKGFAQLRMALASGTGDIVIALSKNRPLDQKEQDSLARQREETAENTAVADVLREQVGVTGLKTEYDGGVETLGRYPGFTLLERPERVGTVDVGGRANGEEESGDLTHIGHINGRRVLTQEVPRVPVFEGDGVTIAVDGRGREKYDQPNAAQLLIGAAELLRADSGAVLTSSTYYPSRVAFAAQAVYESALAGGSPPQIEVAAFCPTSLAQARRPQVSGPDNPGLWHLLAEVQWAGAQFQNLAESIGNGFQETA